jgi:hypothetical protein
LVAKICPSQVFGFHYQTLPISRIWLNTELMANTFVQLLTLFVWYIYNKSLTGQILTAKQPGRDCPLKFGPWAGGPSRPKLVAFSRTWHWAMVGSEPFVVVIQQSRDGGFFFWTLSPLQLSPLRALPRIE